MARKIVVNYKGKDSSFNFKKIKRDMLYGKKKRVFLDDQDKECRTAAIEKKYGLLILSGDASSVYIDSNKNFVSKDSISGLDNDGNILERFQSTLNVSQELEKIDENDILDFNCSSLYKLEEEDMDQSLKKSLEKGDIYKFDFNYYSDFNLEMGILLMNEYGFFALIGNDTKVPWIDKEETHHEFFETPEVDEIDFEML